MMVDKAMMNVKRKKSEKIDRMGGRKRSKPFSLRVRRRMPTPPAPPASESVSPYQEIDERGLASLRTDASQDAHKVRCPKCDSLMVSERFMDYDQSGEPSFNGWRCISCGMILDPVILVHRAQQKRKQRENPMAVLLEEVEVE